MTHLILATTKAELRAKWKQMYRVRKEIKELPEWYGYYTGKMEYTAWLLVNAREVGDNE